MPPSKRETPTETPPPMTPELAALLDSPALLRRIFAAVEAEADANPAFRQRIVSEIAAELAGKVAAPASAPAEAQPSPATPEPVEAAVDPADLPDVNPLAVIDQDGPDALRDELRFTRRKEPLIKLARAYALDVPQTLLKKKMPVWRMIDAIIDAAERRVREQKLSAG